MKRLQDVSKDCEDDICDGGEGFKMNNRVPLLHHVVLNASRAVDEILMLFTCQV